jgi:hypothetical protein
MPQLEHIEAIEKRLWSAADTLRANSNYASNEYFLPVMGLVFLRRAYSRYLGVKDAIEANLPKRGVRHVRSPRKISHRKVRFSCSPRPSSTRFRMEKHEAEALLQTAVGNHVARFRDGQWEAIDALVNDRRKLMVVQRTGWGKSSVYFISTCILRDRGAGLTVIVSPLLALMRNQITAANRLGIRAETINSTNQDNWPEISQAMLADQVDAILISPERLSNEAFVEEVLLPVADRVGLLVVDEVHCIFDWGTTSALIIGG